MDTTPSDSASEPANTAANETKMALAELIKDALARAPFQLTRTTDEVAGMIQVPKDAAMGDFAFPCFALAKELKQAPPKIAATLGDALGDALRADPCFASAIAAGPYLNVALDKARQFAEVIPKIVDGTFTAARPPRGERVMIEYSQPNTHKVFHVGHTRNVALGDACVRLCRFAGFDVVAANYIGDVGTHIAKCLWYFRTHWKGDVPDTDRGAFLGEMYSAADRMLDLSRMTSAPFPGVTTARVISIEAHPSEPRWKVVRVQTATGEKTVVCGGIGFADGDVVAYAGVGAKVGKRRVGTADRAGVSSEGMICGDAEIKQGEDNDKIHVFPEGTAVGVEIAEVFRIQDATDPQVPLLEEYERRQRGVREVLKALEQGEPEITALWQETRQWSLDEFQEIYRWIGAQFDHDFYESEVADAGKAIVKRALDDGILIRSEGAIGADLTAHKLPFFMLQKSDGTGLYSTKDLALAKRKFDDFHIDRSIYVVDISQSLHFQQVFATLTMLGYEKAKLCHHLAYGMVMLPDGKMSSRDGNVIPFVRLRDNLTEHIRTKFLDPLQENAKEDWSPEQIADTARRVAIGTIRYGMLNQDNNKNIVFDLEEWSNPSGNTGPYLMYAYTRTRSILREIDGYDIAAADWSGLNNVTEHGLLATLLRFDKAVADAVKGYQPQLLCIYLYDLAKDFSRFYRECSVKHAENPGLRHARAALVDSTGRVLGRGLELLGIQPVERM